ncbi:PfkB family carbohydrate kinase [Amycolatopsis endophytica]|uniref:Sugar/nucleoside kinase (Ribokinase family) n=1 Tax=Amycolatopsis endophytica TaxID=860233 RepID=A0A853AVS8_9PSEU|nr:PfkB family carbohydrate kinase [Amycolatopsis endophytica]NYI86737.1 sugar/nucleoside kinase (ribokinase family) [Amycolatopsis endophytica]
MSRLVHTGQVIVDLVLQVPGLPERGGDLLASGMALTPGGGFNVMAAAARSGAEVVYAGAHGIGRFGDAVRAALGAEGISVAGPPLSDVDTGVCVVLVDDGGERTFVTGTGAEGRMVPGQFATVAVSPGDVVYVSGYTLAHPANREALLDWLPSVSGARVLFDPGPLAADLPVDLVMPYVDILSCNAAEARTLSGKDSLTAAASVLGGTVVVRDGPAGCLLAENGVVRKIPGFPVEPVDTNGAGDAHCGVLAAELLAGADLATAARRANAAAALSVQRRGPATAPGHAEIDAFLGQHG